MSLTTGGSSRLKNRWPESMSTSQLASSSVRTAGSMPSSCLHFSGM